MEAPFDTQALWGLSLELYEHRRYDDAIDCMLRLKPHLPGNARLLANLGVAYRDNGDLEVAEEYLRDASALSPEDPAIHFNLALTLLRAGRLRAGFREYEWRWKIRDFAALHRQFEEPLWGGEPPDGRRILLYGEQGAGDAIQFVRYAPLVRAAGGDVVIEVLPHLERLMRWMPGRQWIVTALTENVQVDVQCPMMTLPRRFGTELASIPPPAISLAASPVLGRAAEPADADDYFGERSAAI